MSREIKLASRENFWSPRALGACEPQASREVKVACRDNSEMPRLFNVRETSDILRCSEAKVWGMLKAGELRRIKIGASTRIAREDVLRLIAPADGIFS